MSEHNVVSVIRPEYCQSPLCPTGQPWGGPARLRWSKRRRWTICQRCNCVTIEGEPGGGNI